MMHGADRTPLLTEEEEELGEDTDDQPDGFRVQTTEALQNGYLKTFTENNSDNSDSDNGIIQEEVDFSEFLEKHIGDSGRYQWITMIAVCLVDLVDCMLTLGPVFIAAVPEYTCDVSDYTAAFNCTKDEAKNIFIPKEKRHGKWMPSQCQYFSHVPLINETHESCSHLNLTDHSTAHCDEWAYDSTFYTSTIVTEWNLVCSKEHLVANATSVYWIGVILGLLIGGHLADRWGRKPTAVVGYILMTILGVATAFSPNYYVFLALRCLMSLFQTFRGIGVWIACYEVLAGGYRITGFALENLAWCLGYFLMAGIAYFERRWRYLQIYILLPDILGLLLVAFYYTESPRWLLTQDRKTEAMKHLYLIAKRNKKTVPSDVIPIIKKESKSISAHQLLKWPGTRTVSLVLFYLWMGMGLVYYGISMNTGNMGGNPFVNFVISGIVDLVSGMVALLVLEKFGRVLPFAYGLLVGGVVLILSIAIPAENHKMILAIAMSGKLFTAIPGSCTWLYALEIYPTSIRSIGVHICSIMARIGAIGASYLGILTHDSRSLPLLIYGVSALIGGLLAFILPETKDQPLTQTVEEGEEFMRENICMAAPCGRCRKTGRVRRYRTVDTATELDDNDCESNVYSVNDDDELLRQMS